MEKSVDYGIGGKTAILENFDQASIFPDLIFVTDITDYICGEKSVMWRNFRFL